jgi:hypothetical protein
VVFGIGGDSNGLPALLFYCPVVSVMLDAEYVDPLERWAELREGNRKLGARLREVMA